MKKFQIGYISSLAATPLLVCKHLGWFQQRGWQLGLTRQVGWRSLANRLFYGELDGGIMHPSMLIAMAAGRRSEQLNCRGCFGMSYGGMALVGRSSTQSFAEQCRRKGELRFGTFSPDFPDSCVIEHWMRDNGLSIQEVKLVTVPIPVTQSISLIKEGFVDAYLSYQPWIQIARKHGIGEALTRVSDEGTQAGATRILAIKNDFLRTNDGFYAEISGLLNRAAEWIADPDNGETLLEILRPESWELDDEQLLGLFHPVGVGGEDGVRCRFQRPEGDGPALTIEDVEAFWRFFCASTQNKSSGDAHSLPNWAADLFRVQTCRV
ncbi:ABC transporter substrate-binding protein [Pelagicoccus sp. SDUM812003]|uniref:ABC transporter substrate-binding protein n=1 Tax=Pelagicoccus sp. SDUM812003 TaxID=3041267 RepID=UPI00280D9571|nr:ABC transporter substrate-binding protein [Pelagicoccus sp. SDUM812003]MDQ8204668.1 ABC transporter substrate-binding protein [Pelagicoccus sp. SDUM812003]